MDWSAGLRMPRGAEMRSAGVSEGVGADADPPDLENVGLARAHLAVMEMMMVVAAVDMESFMCAISKIIFFFFWHSGQFAR